MSLLPTGSRRDLDRSTWHLPGEGTHPVVAAMDAWQEGEQFIVEFDLPGVQAESLDLFVERNVLTVRAERRGLNQSHEMVSAERPRGVLSRQLFLGEHLDTARIDAAYRDGVLRLTIPVADRARRRRIAISHDGQKLSATPSGQRRGWPQRLSRLLWRGRRETRR